MSERTALLGSGGAGGMGGRPRSNSVASISWSELCGRRALSLDAAMADARCADETAYAVRDLCGALCGARGSEVDSLAAAGALWDAALGGALPRPAVPSEQWKYLGFQGTSPLTDMRSPTALVTMRLVARALASQPADHPLRAEAARAALGASPPFALALLNSAHMLTAHLHLAATHDAPPAFCPCCGAAIRVTEYGRRAVQSHRGGGVHGYLVLATEADAAMAGDTVAGVPLTGPEAALVELIELSVLWLGAAWRAAAPSNSSTNDALLSSASIDAMHAQLRSDAAAGRAQGHGDVRLLSFPRLLADARGAVLAALAALGNGGAGFGGVLVGLTRGLSSSMSPLRQRRGGGYRDDTEVVRSPLAVLQSGGDRPARASIRAALRAL